MCPLKTLCSVLLISLACYIVACSNHKESIPLNNAESLMEAYPDSALVLLESMDKSELASKNEQARYSLLMSMALDKNYIDTTNFDVLQPAIDYYLKNGTADEILKTYYYEGIIYLNRGDREKALNSFTKGVQLAHVAIDDLAVARLYVGLGGLYNQLYEFENYVYYYLKAGEKYRKLSKKEADFDCLLNALNGTLLLNDQIRCDSLLRILSILQIPNHSLEQRFKRHRLIYALKFGTSEEIKAILLTHRIHVDSKNDIFNIALAYIKIEDYRSAYDLLNLIHKDGHPYDTLRFLSISVPILEGTGAYKEALNNYRLFSHKQDSINLHKIGLRVQTLEEKHKIEILAQEEARKKSRIIWSCVGGIIILTLFSLSLILFNLNIKSKKNLALQKARTTELENEKLKSERDKKALEAENLVLQVKELEKESENLKSLLENPVELPEEVQNEIKIRIEMLNALLAGYITSNEQFEKPYDTWIKEVTSNTEKFMNSNRLAFQVSHPRFIRYFEDHGLTVNEINYVCLYAIGLKGKDVGNYMKKRSHVNISSGIRKKLGIDKHETNIGIYVRKLLKEL